MNLFNLLDSVILKVYNEEKKREIWEEFVSFTDLYEKVFKDKLKEEFLKQGEEVVKKIESVFPTEQKGLVQKYGTAQSGNRGHSGNPGHVGGSGSGSGGGGGKESKDLKYCQDYIATLIQKWPFLKGEINSVVLKDLGDYERKIAEWREHEKQIIINSNIFKNRQEFEDTYNFYIEEGYHPKHEKGSALDAVLTHEVGHRVFELLENNDKFKEFAEKNKPNRKEDGIYPTGNYEFSAPSSDSKGKVGTWPHKESVPESFVQINLKAEKNWSKYTKNLYPIIQNELTSKKSVVKEISSEQKSIIKKDISDFTADKNKWDVSMQKLLSEMFTNIIADMGAGVLAGLVSEQLFDVAIPGVQDFINDWSYKLAFDVNDETMKLLKNELGQGIDAGEGMGKIADRVQALFTDMSDYRAQRIARTETIRASNYATEEAYIQSGVVKAKKWLSAIDERTCALCGRLDGKVIGLGENYFSLGETYSIEDKEGKVIESMPIDYTDIKNPPLHPFCRCCTVPVIMDNKVEKVRRTRASKVTPFPDSIENLMVMGGAGGTTGAKIYKDGKGNKFVGKYGKTKDHLLNECQADTIYRTLGVDVPEYKLYDTPKGPLKVTRFIEDGKLLSDFLETATSAEKAVMYAKLQKGFAADALVGNWDVMGTGFDNILIDKTGKPWRIDNGGSFEYRAQGEGKLLNGNDANVWDGNPYEIWGMRKQDNIMQARGQYSKAVFSSMKYADVVDEMGVLVKNKRKILKSIDSVTLKDTVGKRIESMSDMVDIFDRMSVQDVFKAEYVDKFSENIMAMRRFGVTKTLPEKLAYKGSGTPGTISIERNLPMEKYDVLYGGNGMRFGGLQDSMASYMETPFYNYCQQYGIDIRQVRTWYSDQQGSSWSKYSKVVKYSMAEQMKVPIEDIFWGRSGFDGIKANAQTIGVIERENLMDAVIANHAYTYEILTHTKIPNVDMAKKTMTVVRGLGRNSSERYGIMELGEYSGSAMKNATYESASIFHIADGWKNTELNPRAIYENLPVHRILGSYLTNPLYSIEENEVLAMFVKSPFKRTAGDSWFQ